MSRFPRRPHNAALPRCSCSPRACTRSRTDPTLRFALILLLTISLIGCASQSLTPQTAAADLMRDLPHNWAATESPSPGSFSRHLLDLIDDPRVHELVAEALESNHDLRAAARRLEASHRLLVETRAIRRPMLEAGYGANRGNQGFGTWLGATTETRHRASVSLSWELDVWGRLGALDREAIASNQSEAADLAAARDALGARVIQTWITIVALRQELRVEQNRAVLLEQLQTTITRRYRSGLGTLDDLAAARADAELAKASITEIRGEISRSTRRMELLLGRMPRAEVLTSERLPNVELNIEDSPLRAIARRPDVAAALLRLEAADASAAAAAKTMLPGLSLSSDVLRDSISGSGLFSTGSLWNVALSLTQPIFQSGALKARRDARRLEFDAAWEECRSTILNAAREVEDGLDLETELVLQRGHLDLALAEATRTASIFEARYRSGIASIMELLQARNLEMDIRRRLIATKGATLSNRITLALALGAGIEE